MIEIQYILHPPLYESLGFVRHITKWHSISSGKTNLLHTGHLIPGKDKYIRFVYVYNC